MQNEMWREGKKTAKLEMEHKRETSSGMNMTKEEKQDK